jgi:hypothetical protein
MRPPLLAAAFIFLSSAVLFAAREAPGSALGALKLLPKGEAKKIARIEAREGTPVPERWHILVHDPKDENGLHEYVVAGGELVASRNLSQFAEFVKEEDVFGSSGLKVDSDKLAELAQQYALANNQTITALNYALRKEGAAAAPLWVVTCLDEMGKEIGRLVVSAARGHVVSREGFTAEPNGPKLEVATEVAGDRPRPTRGYAHAGEEGFLQPDFFGPGR